MGMADTERTQQAQPEDSWQCPGAGSLGQKFSNWKRTTFPFNSELTKQYGGCTTTLKKILNQGRIPF